MFSKRFYGVNNSIYLSNNGGNSHTIGRIQHPTLMVIVYFCFFFFPAIARDLLSILL